MNYAGLSERAMKISAIRIISKPVIAHTPKPPELEPFMTTPPIKVFRDKTRSMQK